jgi:hypothetical protein
VLLWNRNNTFIFMIFHVAVAVNNTKLFSVAMETQQYIHFYAFTRRCSCQQYKIVNCCHGNATYIQVNIKPIVIQASVRSRSSQATAGQNSWLTRYKLIFGSFLCNILVFPLNAVGYAKCWNSKIKYRCAPVSTGNTFQDLTRLRETADNIKRYI